MFLNKLRNNLLPQQMFPGAANAETFASATLILFRRLRTPQEL